MKKYSCLAFVVLLSSASFVRADIDSKRLIQSIFHSFDTKKMLAREISKPMVFEKDVVLANKPNQKPLLIAQSFAAAIQNDAMPIVIGKKTELLPQTIEPPVAVKESLVPQRKNIVAADVWIRDHHLYGGLIITGCDEAVDREYGSDLPEILLCKCNEEGTVYRARSAESDPHSRGYIWNYR